MSAPGVWKRKFPISIGCRLNITIILQTIVAAAVLYNTAADNNENVPPTNN